MIERQGTVSAVTSRDFQSVKLWSLKLEGSDRYFRAGKVEPDVQEGENVVFEEKNGIIIMDTLKVTDGEPKTKVETTMTEIVKQSDQPSAVGRRMQVQAARSNATEIVCAALQCDHLPHSANTAKGKRLDLLIGYVDEVTKALLEQEKEYETQ